MAWGLHICGQEVEFLGRQEGKALRKENIMKKKDTKGTTGGKPATAKRGLRDLSPTQKQAKEIKGGMKWDYAKNKEG